MLKKESKKSFYNEEDNIAKHRINRGFAAIWGGGNVIKI